MSLGATTASRALDVALVSCQELPEPDLDAAPLLEALRQAGLRAAVLAWDDSSVDWSCSRLALLRSTWNYPWHVEAFSAWCERVAGATRLLNPLPAIRWNMHKSYLLELERRGVPTTPTRVLTRRQQADLDTVLARCDWTDLVIKPAISAGSFRTRRFARSQRKDAQAFVDELLQQHDVMVQCYLPSVESHGERALIWIDGELCHAVRKAPRFSGDDEAVTGPWPISDQERGLALRAIAAAPAPLLYARVDMAPGPDGDPVLMELELIEPSLFFAHGPDALRRLVVALQHRLRT